MCDPCSHVDVQEHGNIRPPRTWLPRYTDASRAGHHGRAARCALAICRLRRRASYARGATIGGPIWWRRRPRRCARRAVGDRWSASQQRVFLRSDPPRPPARRRPPAPAGAAPRPVACPFCAMLFRSTSARHRIRHGIRHTAARAGRHPCPCITNGRLRHILIGSARVSKADGSQSLDSTAACARSGRATCSSSGSSTASAAASPT